MPSFRTEGLVYASHFSVVVIAVNSIVSAAEARWKFRFSCTKCTFSNVGTKVSGKSFLSDSGDGAEISGKVESCPMCHASPYIATNHHTPEMSQQPNLPEINEFVMLANDLLGILFPRECRQCSKIQAGILCSPHSPLHLGTAPRDMACKWLRLPLAGANPLSMDCKRWHWNFLCTSRRHRHGSEDLPGKNSLECILEAHLRCPKTFQTRQRCCLQSRQDHLFLDIQTVAHRHSSSLLRCTTGSVHARTQIPLRYIFGNSMPPLRRPFQGGTLHTGWQMVQNSFLEDTRISESRQGSNTQRGSLKPCHCHYNHRTRPLT
jgi:hypothetical protein